MSQISVTLQFASQDELLAFFTGKTQPNLTGGASLKGEGLKVDPPKSSKGAVTQTATGTAAAKAGPAAESPSEGNAGAADSSAQGKADASTASAVVPYATLQKAVFALANKSRDAVVALASELKLGETRFKFFESEDNAGGRAAALAAVNAKLAELEVA